MNEISPSPGSPGAWRALIWASRPRTLPASTAPVLVGSAAAFAEGGFRPGPAVAALVGAVMLQVGANLTNDAVDFERGADTPARLGPLRVTLAGWLPARRVKLAAAAAFAAACLCGVYLAMVAGWPVLVLGLVSILAAVAYTGGPFPLAHNGLGDPFVMLFFGFVAVCGTAFVQLGRVPTLAWALSAPVGALITAILVVNNVRDRPTDAKAGRRTIPVVFGRRAGVAEYAALLAIAALAPIVLAIARAASPWVLLPLCVMPWGAFLCRTLAITEGPPLNRTLARTALLALAYSALLALGIAIGRGA